MAEQRRRTRWSEIAADLTDAIAQNRYPVGTDLPSEAELCTTYDVSRFTVREALRRLSEAGLISRRHGSGSRVVATSPPQAYVLGVESETDVLRYAAETTMTLTGSPKPVSGAAASSLVLGPAPDWFQVSGVREAPGGTRIGLVEVYLRAEHREILDEIGNPVNGAIFTHLLRRYRLTLSGIEQTISAVSLKPAQARRLRAEPGEPSLRIMRRYLSEESGVIELSVHIHPASRFEYSLRIDPMQVPLPEAGGRGAR